MTHHHRLDAAARALQASMSRRDGLIAAAAGAAAALLGQPSSPGASARRGRMGAEGPCGDGGLAANRCQRNAGCCTGICRRTPGGVGRCRCRRRGGRCDAARNCCGTMICRQGACIPSGCGPETCADGCCQRGICVVAGGGGAWPALLPGRVR
ncbi:MAG: hypothetical protein ACKOWF_05815, partial [Chloroflexota bacterium]